MRIAGFRGFNRKNGYKSGKVQLLKILTSIAILVEILLWEINFGRSRNSPLIMSIFKPGCNVKGNISFNAGNKIYHLPGMEDYASTVINSSSGE